MHIVYTHCIISCIYIYIHIIFWIMYFMHIMQHDMRSSRFLEILVCKIVIWCNMRIWFRWLYSLFSSISDFSALAPTLEVIVVKQWLPDLGMLERDWVIPSVTMDRIGWCISIVSISTDACWLWPTANLAFQFSFFCKQVMLLFFLPAVCSLKLLRYFDACLQAKDMKNSSHKAAIEDVSQVEKGGATVHGLLVAKLGSKESFRLLIDACRNSVPALPVLVYTMSVITLLSSSAIYLVESRDNIPSMLLGSQDGYSRLTSSFELAFRMDSGEYGEFSMSL